jgi:HPr kinase/phosphorylase
MNSKQFLIGAEKSFPFRILSGEGLDREITEPCAHVYDGTEGFWHSLKSGQIIIVDSENLNSLTPEKISATSCLFVSGCESCPAGFLDLFAAKSIPLVASGMERHFLASRVTGLLREKLESTVYLHGSMVVYKGIGVLLTGDSGAGKSRCCLDLIGRGAGLVADDLVKIIKQETSLYGMCPEQIRGMIEIRGAGLIDISSIFGESAVAQESAIDIAFEISGTGAAPCRAEGEAVSDSALVIMGVEIPLRTVRADCGKTVSQYVKDSCEERCRDNYR